jgi:maleate cis-trans isomerase
VEQSTGLSAATWSKAVDAALRKFSARRIGLLCPFDPQGLANAIGFFENLGYEVASAAGLGCASGTDVGHVPDAYKEKVIRERLIQENIDAIVICGTNLASLALAEKLEQELASRSLESIRHSYGTRCGKTEYPLRYRVHHDYYGSSNYE